MKRLPLFSKIEYISQTIHLFCVSALHWWILQVWRLTPGKLGRNFFRRNLPTRMSIWCKLQVFHLLQKWNSLRDVEWWRSRLWFDKRPSFAKFGRLYVVLSDWRDASFSTTFLFQICFKIFHLVNTRKCLQ